MSFYHAYLGWTLAVAFVIAGLGGGVPPCVSNGSAEPFSLAPVSKLFPAFPAGGLDESWLLGAAKISSCSIEKKRIGKLVFQITSSKIQFNTNTINLGDFVQFINTRNIVSVQRISW